MFTQSSQARARGHERNRKDSSNHNTRIVKKERKLPIEKQQEEKNSRDGGSQQNVMDHDIGAEDEQEKNIVLDNEEDYVEELFIPLKKRYMIPETNSDDSSSEPSST